MRIGLFTDTYFPQVSGVATSIRTLKTELEKIRSHGIYFLRRRTRMSIVMRIGRLFGFPAYLSLPLRTEEWLIEDFLMP